MLEFNGPYNDKTQHEIQEISDQISLFIWKPGEFSSFRSAFPLSMLSIFFDPKYWNSVTFQTWTKSYWNLTSTLRVPICMDYNMFLCDFLWLFMMFLFLFIRIFRNDLKSLIDFCSWLKKSYFCICLDTKENAELEKLKRVPTFEAVKIWI